MTFLWRALNFQVLLDEGYRAAALEVFKSPKKIESAKPRISVSILPLSEQKTLSGEVNLSWKSLHSGLWAGDLEGLRFWHFIKTPLHPPQLLSAILMQLIKSIGLRFDCALLHSACVLQDGKALVIPGKEGRGKTTLSRLLPGRILNDDLTLIAKNESGGFEAYCVPTHQDLSGSHPFTWEGPFALKRVIFLRRENPRGVVDLKNTSAKTHLLEEGPFLEFPESEKDRAVYSERLHAFFEEMLEKTPSCCVSYDPSKDKEAVGKWLMSH